MNYQQQIDKIKQQIKSSSEALDNLNDTLNSNSPETSSETPETTNSDFTNKALASYLALGASIKDDAVLTMILQSAMYVVGAGGAGLTLLDPEINALVFKAAIGDGAEGIIGYQVPLEGSQHGLAFATGEIQSSSPINSDIEKTAKTQFKNVLVAPLIINEDGVGTISAVNKQNGSHFTPEDMEAYKHFAELAALVVRQRQREEILKDLMTGKTTASDELANVTFHEDDRLLMSIVQDVMKIAQEQEEMLPVCKKITQLLANIGTRNQWG